MGFVNYRSYALRYDRSLRSLDPNKNGSVGEGLGGSVLISVQTKKNCDDKETTPLRTISNFLALNTVA